MISENSQYLEARKKKRKLLIVVSSVLVISVAIIITIIFTSLKEHFTLISIIILIIVFIIILILKPKVMYYSMMEMYFKLLSVSQKKYKIRETFSSEWLRRLVNNGFYFSLQSDEFDILYRVTKPIERKISNTNQVLEIITLIKNEKTSFYNDVLDSEYKKIWLENQGKKQISKQVIMQFKKYGKYEEKHKDELDQIIAYKERKNYLITINCGYFPNDGNIFYFLHSNKFFPNRYYKHGVDLIKEIVK